ncbi:MAG TPA: YHS domain-containing protein [Blastocatellia bacterium]|nr:YHS domain-containing protein [Blastocatellia bacterium]
MTNHTDPVCGMPVDEQQAAGKSGYKGKMYYFCSQDCKTKFDSKPEQFARAETGAQSAGTTRYT